MGRPWIALLSFSWLLLLSVAHAISPIEIKGAKLFTADDGNQFFVKGVAYTRGGVADLLDPLTDTSQCELDAGLMSAIGVNVVRVYYVEPDKDHSGCMQAFASQDIYVWVDISSPLVSINRADPEYTQDMYNRVASVIDAFSDFNNTFSYTMASEVLNADGEVDAAPYVKAAVRDAKAFRDARGYRKIPISYAASDVSTLQLPTKNYLACGDESDAIELYGMNLYSWCGDSSYAESGYDEVYTQFQDTNIPALFTEVGCKNSSTRQFDEVATILGSVFPATFAGTVVYEWTQDVSDYGLVEYPNSDGTGFPSLGREYDNLGSVYTVANPVSTAMADYTPTNTPPSCPTSNSDWPLTGTALPILKAVNIDTVTARTTYNSGATSAAALGTASASASATDIITVPSDRGASAATLSTGAIAGIAVGGAAVGSALVIAAFFILRSRRTKDKHSNGEASDSAESLTYGGARDDGDFSKPELPGGNANGFIGKQELESNHVHEADAGWKVHEMEPTQRVHVYEMAGSRPKASELEGSDSVQQLK